MPAGVLTIASPCILPILPFVLARADQPFRRSGLPMLLGLAIAFAAVASLAAVAGGWAVELNQHGRTVALAVMTLFGLTMLFPALADARDGAVCVARIAAVADSGCDRAPERQRATIGSSVLLGVATGLALGAVRRAGHGLDPDRRRAARAQRRDLAAAAHLRPGRRDVARPPACCSAADFLHVVQRSSQWGDGLRRVLGAAVVAGAAIIWLGADTGLLTRLSSASTTALEQRLIATLCASARDDGNGARGRHRRRSGHCAISAAAIAAARRSRG